MMGCDSTLTKSYLWKKSLCTSCIKINTAGIRVFECLIQLRIDYNILYLMIHKSSHIVQITFNQDGKSQREP